MSKRSTSRNPCCWQSFCRKGSTCVQKISQTNKLDEVSFLFRRTFLRVITHTLLEIRARSHVRLVPTMTYVIDTCHFDTYTRSKWFQIKPGRNRKSDRHPKGGRVATNRKLFRQLKWTFALILQAENERETQKSVVIIKSILFPIRPVYTLVRECLVYIFLFSPPTTP